MKGYLVKETEGQEVELFKHIVACGFQSTGAIGRKGGDYT